MKASRQSSAGKWIAMAFVLFLLVVSFASAVGTYNGLVTLDQRVNAQWAQVENAYQRRLDLIPNLVNTVRGSAAFERETLTAVVEARARAGQATASVSRAPDDPATLAKYQAAQQGLSSTLSRLMVVVERYPELRSTQNFRDLQAQLEGTENRIAVERMRFNEAAQAFNSRRNRFPAVLFAGLFGSRFREKPYFSARAGAESAPTVQF